QPTTATGMRINSVAARAAQRYFLNISVLQRRHAETIA
ncbi:unnamed protein product, partial [marine sediment metagenome]